jgi:hypothetical protein
MVHEKVLEAYEANDFEYYKRAEDYNEEAFFDQATAAKQPINKEIVKVVRLKSNKKEYFYFHVELKSHNYLGNKIHLYRIEGKYNLPEFNKDIDPKTNKPRTIEVENLIPTYEYEWDKDWKEEYNDLMSENTDFVLVTSSRKYGGFSFHDFKELPFDQLVTLGRFGTTNPAVIEGIKKGRVKAG